MLGVGLVAGRAGDPDVHGGERAGLHQRVRDVVAVADVGHGDVLELAEVLLQREQVGERLARMVVIGQRVDHRHRRRGGDRFDVRLRERADDDRRAVGGQDARRVGDRLAAAELELVGAQHDRHRPEPVDGRLDRDARARRRLGEVARDRLAAQRLVPAARPPLHRGGELEQLLELTRAQVGDAQQVLGVCGSQGGSSGSPLTLRKARRVRSGRTCSGDRRDHGRARSRRS